MQTKLKPIFFLVTLAAAAFLLYAANDARAQVTPIGIFNVSAFSPSVISISPKLEQSNTLIPRDSIQAPQQQGKSLKGTQKAATYHGY